MMATYTWSTYVKTDTVRPKLFCAGSSGYTPLSGCPPTNSVDVGPGNELNCKMYYFNSYTSAGKQRRTATNTTTPTTITTSTVFYIPFSSKRTIHLLLLLLLLLLVLVLLL
jgi:hypothetical protein